MGVDKLRTFVVALILIIIVLAVVHYFHPENPSSSTENVQVQSGDVNNNRCEAGEVQDSFGCYSPSDTVVITYVPTN